VSPKDVLSDAINAYLNDENEDIGERFSRDLAELLAEDRDYHLRQSRVVADIIIRIYGK
jgi:hypothetical protein